MKSKLLVTLAMALIAKSALAQQTETDIGTHIPVPYRARVPDAVGVSEIDRGRIVADRYARCEIDRDRSRIVAALSLPDEESQNKALGKAISSECLSDGTLRMASSALRGAIFAELVRRRQQNQSRTPNLLAYDLSRAATASEDAKVYWWLMDFADCVVRKDKDDALGFVIAPAASAAETKALASLKTMLGPCVASGSTMTLNRTVIKGALAEVLYRGPAAKADAGGKK